MIAPATADVAVAALTLVSMGLMSVQVPADGYVVRPAVGVPDDGDHRNPIAVAREVYADPSVVDRSARGDPNPTTGPGTVRQANCDLDVRSVKADFSCVAAERDSGGRATTELDEI